MKNILLVVFAMGLGLITACHKKNYQSVIVIKDCTGSYLRWNSADYKVCNLEAVSNYNNLAVITADFRKISSCTGSGSKAIVCMMLHVNEGWITVYGVK
jgi:hypothetical protein